MLEPEPVPTSKSPLLYDVNPVPPYALDNVPLLILVAFKLVNPEPEPLNCDDDNVPVLAWYCKTPESEYNVTSPVAALMKGSGSCEDDVESDTDILAAEPDVFWLPAVFTPGKFISTEPSNGTPPINLAVVSLAAEPDHAEADNVPVELVPTITRSTYISPELSLATKLLDVFVVVPCTSNVAILEPL